jgi:hypothetical protein
MELVATTSVRYIFVQIVSMERYQALAEMIVKIILERGHPAHTMFVVQYPPNVNPSVLVVYPIIVVKKFINLIAKKVLAEPLWAMIQFVPMPMVMALLIFAKPNHNTVVVVMVVNQLI